MSQKGYKLSEEHKKKLSEAMEGRNPNVGLETRFKKGHKSFMTDEVKGKISMAMKGIQHTEDARKKMSIAAKGRKFSEETRKKLRERIINNPNKIFKNTSIELKVEEELRNRNIDYQKQVPLCKVAVVDFYLPEYRIVIQCDGDYWHNLPDHKVRDEIQDRVLNFNGFNIFRFWEHEIDTDVKKCIDKINLWRH